MLDEGLLQGMKGFPSSKSFDRLNLSPFNLGSQDQTGMDRRSINENRAGPAFPDSATLLRSGEAQFLSKHPDERPVRRRLHFYPFAIERKSDLNLHKQFNSES
jgi:hypothetical protein